MNESLNIIDFALYEIRLWDTSSIRCKDRSSWTEYNIVDSYTANF
jgi:hypothetical protein